jgi:hypothetical protein
MHAASRFIVKDGSGQKLAYVYFEDEPGRRSAASRPTKDEARRIAANVAKLPEMLRQPQLIEAKARHAPSKWVCSSCRVWDRGAGRA